ncbi:MAG TPA: hypothetical protein PLP34_00350 [Chitinophagaceae bacterium]|nr:hypothetical protein [Chitinophagaceae bacterium]HNF70829.1 hypothetical protein [Chitinophagaceae bacterium]
MHKLLSLILLSGLFFLIACSKGPGVGGRASIKGRVYAHNYSNSFVLNDSGYLGGQKVYIRYGDQPGVGDDVDTDNEGYYYFPYLRKGTYTVYVYSKQLNNNTLDTAIIQQVEIDERKQELILPQFNIITFKN